MLKIAVVGLGWAGTRHVQAIRELAQAAPATPLQVVALVDADPDHLRAKATELNVAQTKTDYAALLADPAIDAVSLCTPHSLHAPMAIAAAEAGKQVLVEKPMALTVSDATRMLDAAAANGVKLFVAENAAYTPQARFLRKIVTTGESLGALTAASFQGGFRAPDFGYPGRRSWLTRPEQGGTGTWMLHGIHSVAQLRYIFGATFGEIETVYLREHKTASFQRVELEGTMSGLLTLSSGLSIAILQTSESKLRGDLGGYLLHGERGSIRATAAGYRLFATDDTEVLPALTPYPESELSSYALEMQAFADFVAGTSASPAWSGPTTGESERRSLAVVQAGYESAATGQAIDLQTRFGEVYA